MKPILSLEFLIGNDIRALAGHLHMWSYLSVCPESPRKSGPVCFLVSSKAQANSANIVLCIFTIEAMWLYISVGIDPMSLLHLQLGKIQSSLVYIFAPKLHGGSGKL